MANANCVAPQTLRQFVFPTNAGSSRYLLTMLASLSVCFIWREYYKLAICVACIIAFAYISDKNAVVEGKKQAESLIVIKGVGVQLTKTTRKGTSSHLFLDSTQVKDVIINEVRLVRE